MTHSKEISVPWAQIVAAVVVSGVLGAVTMYAAQASMRTEIDTTMIRVTILETTLNQINTRLSHIEGALGVKKWSE